MWATSATWQRKGALITSTWHFCQERTIIQSGDGSKKDRLKNLEEFSSDECPSGRFGGWVPRYTMFKEDHQGRSLQE